MPSLLPTESKPTIWKPNRLKYLLIGGPKWGKTTFFSGVPNCVLLAFEAGYAEVDCPKIVITNWDRPLRQRKLGWDVDDDGIRYTGAQEVIEEMERKNPYDFVILDTMDMLAKMAGDYMCKQAGVDHPSQGGDYGRGWDVLQNNPVRKFYNRIVRLGCGVAAITHKKEKGDTNKFGESKPRKETSLPGGIQHFIHTQSDCIMMAAFTSTGKRYITFAGRDDVMAGTRIRKVYIPIKYIVDAPTRTDDSPPWRQWENFFINNPQAGIQAEREFQLRRKVVVDSRKPKAYDKEKDNSESDNSDQQTYQKASAQKASGGRGGRLGVS